MLPETTGDDNLSMVVSSGWYGVSKAAILKMDLNTCKYTESWKQMLSKKQFSEGMARVGSTIYQLTWQENQILKWNIENQEKNDTKLKLMKTLDMPKNNKIREGWGLAPYKCSGAESDHNCKELIATDGSN